MAWLSLDSEDGDLPAFLHALVTAMQQVVGERPRLLLWQGWVEYVRAGAIALGPLAQRVEAILDGDALQQPPDQVAALRAETDALWTVIWYARGDLERAVSCGARAWDSLPPTAVYALDLVSGILSRCQPRRGAPATPRALLAASRALANPGPWLARRLRDRDSHDGAAEPARHVLAAFGPRPAVVRPALPRGTVPDALIEPLTERELEVLALLAGRLSNKEVARTLQISWHTVTKHTVNIYQKLAGHRSPGSGPARPGPRLDPSARAAGRPPRHSRLPGAAIPLSAVTSLSWSQDPP